VDRSYSSSREEFIAAEAWDCFIIAPAFVTGYSKIAVTVIQQQDRDF
jgi:hypothetical protein